MCNFMSVIATRDGKIFTAPDVDSHELLIQHLRLRDDRLVDRRWVRLECVSPFDKVKVDEIGTLPGWYDEKEADIESRVLAFVQEISSHRKICNEAYKSAEAGFNESIKPPQKIRDDAIATAKKVRDATRLPYEVIRREKEKKVVADRDAALFLAMKTFNARKWWHFRAKRMYDEAIRAAWIAHDNAISEVITTYRLDVQPANEAYDEADSQAEMEFHKVIKPIQKFYSDACNVAMGIYKKSFADIAPKHDITPLKIEKEEEESQF